MSNNIGSMSPWNWSTAAAQGKDSPQKIKGAAQQFEALMIGELLKTAHEGDSSGWLGTGEEDEAGQNAIDMAQQQLASVMAKSGGLGLTKTITEGLEQRARNER